MNNFETITRFSNKWWIDFPYFVVYHFFLMAVAMSMVITVEINATLIIPIDSLLNDFIAPVIEESFKFLMLYLGVMTGIMFTAVFSVIECVRFFIYANSHFTEVPDSFYVIRIVCIGFHFMTLWCQIIGVRMYYKYKSWTYLVLGYVVAVFLHFEWNDEAGAFVYAIVHYLYEMVT